METLDAAGFTQQEAVSHVRELCRSYDTNDREACFFGLGRFNSYLLTADPKKAIDWCNSESSDRDKAACYFGETSTAARDRLKEIVQYCGTLPTTAFRSVCYQDLAYYLDANGDSVENAMKFCEAGDVVCEKGFKDFAPDPWGYILKNFRR